MKKNRIREGQFHFVMQGTPIIESVKDFIFKAKTNGNKVWLVPPESELDEQIWSVVGEKKSVRMVKEAFNEFCKFYQHPLSTSFLLMLKEE